MPNAPRDQDRIILIEDTAKLYLPHINLVRQQIVCRFCDVPRLPVRDVGIVEAPGRVPVRKLRRNGGGAGNGAVTH